MGTMQMLFKLVLHGQRKHMKSTTHFQQNIDNTVTESISTDYSLIRVQSVVQATAKEPKESAG